MPSKDRVSRLLKAGPISNEDWVAVLEEMVDCIRPHLKELTIRTLGELNVKHWMYDGTLGTLDDLDQKWGRTHHAKMRGLFFFVYPSDEWRKTYQLPPIIGLTRDGRIAQITFDIKVEKSIQMYYVNSCEVVYTELKKLIPDVISVPRLVVNDLMVIVDELVARRQKILDEARVLQAELGHIRYVVKMADRQ